MQTGMLRLCEKCIARELGQSSNNPSWMSLNLWAQIKSRRFFQTSWFTFDRSWREPSVPYAESLKLAELAAQRPAAAKPRADYIQSVQGSGCGLISSLYCSAPDPLISR